MAMVTAKTIAVARLVLGAAAVEQGMAAIA